MYAQRAHLIIAKCGSTALVRAVHFENTSANEKQTRNLYGHITFNFIPEDKVPIAQPNKCP